MTSRNAPALTGHGLRRVLDGLRPKLRWTGRGPVGRQPQGRVVQVGERGFLLMPGVHLWLHVAAIVEEPWLPNANELCPTAVSVSALLITGLSF